jgi:class 3 adenylate cyclase
MPVFPLALSARLNAGAARVLLDTYLGNEAAAAMLGGRVSLGAVAKFRAVVVYCDLVSFAELTEQLDPRQPRCPEHIFEIITSPVSQAGGQVSGHVGDAVVMFFPIADSSMERQTCATAIRAAVAGLWALEKRNASRGLSGAAERTKAMFPWLDAYNLTRPHSAHKGFSPWTRLNNVLGNDN